MERPLIVTGEVMASVLSYQFHQSYLRLASAYQESSRRKEAGVGHRLADWRQMPVFMNAQQVAELTAASGVNIADPANLPLLTNEFERGTRDQTLQVAVTHDRDGAPVLILLRRLT
jgi:hypothetical protein